MESFTLVRGCAEEMRQGRQELRGTHWQERQPQEATEHCRPRRQGLGSHNPLQSFIFTSEQQERAGRHWLLPRNSLEGRCRAVGRQGGVKDGMWGLRLQKGKP